MSRGRNVIRKDSDVIDLTEFELSKRIDVRERQVRRIEKELKILRRVHAQKKIAVSPEPERFPAPRLYGRGI